MKDIFDSADWARAALAKKEAEAYQPKLEQFQFAAREWIEIKPGAVFEIDEDSATSIFSPVPHP